MSEITAPNETPQLLLDHHLKALRLPTMLREYDHVARQCAAEDLDYPRYLLRMAELELLDRERRATERRIRQAKFPVTKSLDSFDFLAMPTLNKAMVLELARCEFLTRRENVLLLGNSGTGKTHIALALGLAARRQGSKAGRRSLLPAERRRKPRSAHSTVTCSCAPEDPEGSHGHPAAQRRHRRRFPREPSWCPQRLLSRAYFAHRSRRTSGAGPWWWCRPQFPRE